MAELPALALDAPVGAAASSAAGSEGHRARMRARLLGGSGEALADYELLEMLLFLALPRRDTKPIAKALLAAFGSFAAAIAAPVAALRGIEGLGDAGIAALKTVQVAATRLARAEVQDTPVLDNWDRLMAYLTIVLGREKTEQFRVLFLDNRNRLRAIELHATALILVHNHPSGDPTPSVEDIAMTGEVKAAAALLSITLHDHIIVGNGRWFSLRREGLL
jgi:DNA repair protein RadC